MLYHRLKFVILIDRRSKIQLVISQQPPTTFSLTLLKMTTWCNITHRSLKEVKHPSCINRETRSIWHYRIVGHCHQYLDLQFKMNVRYWNGLARKKHNRKIGNIFSSEEWFKKSNLFYLTKEKAKGSFNHSVLAHTQRTVLLTKSSQKTISKF